MVILGMSIWFWLLMLVGVVGLIWTTETESPFLAAMIVAASVAVAHFVFGVSIFALIASSPTVAIGCLFGYLLVGVLWALPKWYFFVRNKRTEYLDELRSFLRGAGYDDCDTATEVPAGLRKEWFRRYGTRNRNLIPLARDHKSRIIHWMAWWPFSMIWTLINDPIRHLFIWTWESLRGVFDAISRSAMGGIEAPVYDPELDSEDDQKDDGYVSSSGWAGIARGSQRPVC